MLLLALACAHVPAETGVVADTSPDVLDCDGLVEPWTVETATDVTEAWRYASPDPVFLSTLREMVESNAEPGCPPVQSVSADGTFVYEGDCTTSAGVGFAGRFAGQDGGEVDDYAFTSFRIDRPDNDASWSADGTLYYAFDGERLVIQTELTSVIYDEPGVRTRRARYAWDMLERVETSSGYVHGARADGSRGGDFCFSWDIAPSSNTTHRSWIAVEGTHQGVYTRDPTLGDGCSAFYLDGALVETDCPEEDSGR